MVQVLMLERLAEQVVLPVRVIVLGKVTAMKLPAIRGLEVVKAISY
jgi:hypothetical protein